MLAKRSLASVLMLFILTCSAATAAEAPTLLTGAAFRKQLDGQVDIVWKDKRALRDALLQLAAAKQIVILMDRRIDPDQLVEFSVSDVSLEQALRQLAQRLNLGITFFDSTVYLGPTSVTYRLATVAAVQHDKTTQLDEARRGKLRSLPAVRTEMLASPRELLEAWAKETGIELHNAERVPHDLWSAIDFPPQTAATRASLILAGFDLAIEFSRDGSAARVVTMPEQPVLTRSYPGGSSPRNRAEQISKQFPRVEVKPSGSELAIAGSFEDHDLIARLLRGEKIRRVEVGPGEKRYTLNVEQQPFGAVARALGEQTRLEVVFDDAVRDKLEERISFRVTDAALEQVLRALVDTVGADFQLMENQLVIVPKK